MNYCELAITSNLITAFNPSKDKHTQSCTKIVPSTKNNPPGTNTKDLAHKYGISNLNTTSFLVQSTEKSMNVSRDGRRRGGWHLFLFTRPSAWASAERWRLSRRRLPLDNKTFWAVKEGAICGKKRWEGYAVRWKGTYLPWYLTIYLQVMRWMVRPWF